MSANHFFDANDSSSVSVLPSNKSLIVADSRFRDRNNLDNTVYDFVCDLQGQGIYAKLLYYQKLVWTQPLFSHNNTNCELIFQVNYREDYTYVVYVTPFIMFGSFDGNEQYGPVNSPLNTPKPYSYAANMELALNGDVRLLTSNQILVNNATGKVPTNPDNPNANSFITINFRYCASRGFCIYPTQNNATGELYTIKILPCSFVEKAHFVHGFGVFSTPSPNSSEGVYLPNPSFSVAVWSDAVPLLLPYRFIIIKAAELNKDRKLLSFSNSLGSDFVNELGVFALSFENTGVMNEIEAGEDATVISLRNGYTPQSFRIQILGENGEVFEEGDPINVLLATNGVDGQAKISYYSGDRAGRGNSLFINYLVFGSKAISPFLNTPVFITPNTYGATPQSMYFKNFTSRSTYTLPYTGSSGNPLTSWYPDVDFANHNLILINSASQYFVPPPGTPDTSIGFGNVILLDQSLETGGYFAMFEWFPKIAPWPSVWLQYLFTSVSYFATPWEVSCFEIWLVMFDAVQEEYIMGRAVQSFRGKGPPIPPTLSNTDTTSKNEWFLNSAYRIDTSINSSIKVGFGFLALDSRIDTFFHVTVGNMYSDNLVPPSKYLFKFQNTVPAETSYTAPEIDPYSYLYGNPLAAGLNSELVHEIATVLEYN